MGDVGGVLGVVLVIWYEYYDKLWVIEKVDSRKVFRNVFREYNIFVFVEFRNFVVFVVKFFVCSVFNDMM